MNYNTLVGQYPVSKTLRFKLNPLGRTLEYIEKNGILESDEVRAERFKKAKKIIDSKHKQYIEKKLKNAELDIDLLKAYSQLYNKTTLTENEKKEFTNVEESLRKQLVEKYFNSKDKEQEKLFNKDLINYVTSDCKAEDIEIMKSFNGFLTYFVGYNTNRKNMYSDEAKTTAIAYRLVNQNLPKYLDNMKVYNRIKECTDIVSQLTPLLDELNLKSVEAFFELEGFNKVLAQSGIDSYNTIIGGISKEDGRKIQGVNELINLHNQQYTEDKLPKLKELFKQILSDRTTISFVDTKYQTSQEVIEKVKEYYNFLNKAIFENDRNVVELILDLENKESQYCLDQIYVKNDKTIADISIYLTKQDNEKDNQKDSKEESKKNSKQGNWGYLNSLIVMDYDAHNTSKNKVTLKYEEAREKELNKKAYYTLEELNTLIKEYGQDNCVKYKVEGYFTEYIEQKVANVKNAYERAKRVLEADYTNKNLIEKDQDIELIKNLLDSIKALQQFIKPLVLEKDFSNKDELFYAELMKIWETLLEVNSLYNRVRNFITQKPYSNEKIKLNFNNSTLLAGWDKNKEKDNWGVIFVKEGNYYLGLLNPKAKKVIEQAPEAKTSNVYQKMEYKLLPDSSKMLPKVFFAKKNIDYYNPSREILRIRETGSYKKGANFSLEDCHTFINFYKDSLEKHPEWKDFNFKFRDTKEYQDTSEFFNEVNRQGYKMTFRAIDEDYINNLVEKGDFYLFQIYNKDFSKYSKGTPNLHTLYWKMVFDESNLKNVVYKLNGEAEIFYRKKSIMETRITHPANEPIANKNTNNPKRESVFTYDLIKDKRYRYNQFQLHIPVTFNFQVKETSNKELNQKVRQIIHDTNNMHIIGIDRGERNLIYISVIDQNGKIVHQESLNTITSDNLGYKVDYHELLTKKEGDNQQTRREWKTIGTIKELKEGYLSQVIHKVAQLVIKYNAIVVLEDLNLGFKKGRQKVERQVYQKFEKMLIDKLNYLVVDKNSDPASIGGLLNAYQLTNKFESFEKLGKQSGILFYIPAWNTSKIDPTTGFSNLFYVKYENMDKAREFIQKFDSIRYNATEDYFEFAFKYSNFTNRAEKSRNEWVACTFGSRIETFRNKDKNSSWDYKEVDLTLELKKLLKDNEIDIDSTTLKEDMVKVNKAEFFQKFIYLFKLMMQLRNSDQTVDELRSPIKNAKGEFFITKVNDKEYPVDADANGAYNIAKKGLWLVEQIKATDALDKVNLKITNQEWLQYAQEHTI